MASVEGVPVARGGYTREKTGGVHYTPAGLAAFVAEQIVARLPRNAGKVRVLDPACGDGELLLAIAAALTGSGVDFELVGFDADGAAVRTATERLGAGAILQQRDFLRWVGEEPGGFDIVIANPPYVRTQVLGGVQARRIAADFGLSGRVDLYQAFFAAITSVLREGGLLGLIASNRFLTVQSGVPIRSLLAGAYEVSRIIDLGDTKLFKAAVLPALIFATRTYQSSGRIPLVSVYRDGTAADAPEVGSIFEVLREPEPGAYRVGDACYRIDVGEVRDPAVPRRPWVAGHRDADWIRRAEERAYCRFGDVGRIRVGIKTTADAVFIGRDWHRLGADCPEEPLLLPLLTHQSARRWRSVGCDARVLYPYELSAAKRTPLHIEDWPRAHAYLEKHRDRLESRRYVVEGGREWWEIWVPQRPSEWSKPKLVFPDISEQPCFFLDTTGAIVNGDCYWMPVEPGARDLAALMLGVANSSFATRFYDARCGNRLYSGRRRFITQYVAEFPLPDPSGPQARRIIGLVSALVDGLAEQVEQAEQAEQVAELDRLVWGAFGCHEIPG